jgi:GAF domain-containing protein
MQAKLDLEKKNRLLEIHSTFLKRFHEATQTSIDDEIHLLLKELGHLYQVDRVYLFDYIDDLKILRNTHEWCNEGISSGMNQFEEISYDIQGKWRHIHQKGESIFVDDIKQIDNEPLKNILISQNIQSLMTQPIMDKDHCVGFMGFDSVKNQRHYSKHEKEALSEFANLILFAKKKVMLELDLKNKEDELNICRCLWKKHL